MKKLSAAFKLLTAWMCVTALKPAPETVGGAVGYFPLVGLFLGLLLALSNYLLAPHLDPKILNLILIALLIAATGAQHLTGLKETFDAPGTESTRRSAGTNNVFGFTAVVLVILFKSTALDSMDELLTLSLMLTPVLARWALVIFLYGHPAAFDENDQLIAARVTIWPVLASTAATLALTVYLLGRKGLWIALIVSLFALLMHGLLARRRTRFSQAHWGAVIECSEALSLILLASL